MLRKRWLGACRRVMRIAVCIAVMSATGVLIGCGSSNDTASGTRSAGATVPPAAEAEAPVALYLNQGSYSVSARATTISGTATRGASVAINGHSVSVHSGHWRGTLHLHIGSNPVNVAATMPGRASGTTAIRVIRHHSAAELEARARASALKAEEAKRHEAERRERKERAEQERREEAAPPPQAECPNGTYENSAGNIVCKPYESATQPAGATAECEDGTYSFSESRSGTCSSHGGVRTWLNE
jgi:hypothetical protein